MTCDFCTTCLNNTGNLDNKICNSCIHHPSITLDDNYVKCDVPKYNLVFLVGPNLDKFSIHELRNKIINKNIGFFNFRDLIINKICNENYQINWSNTSEFHYKDFDLMMNIYHSFNGYDNCYWVKTLIKNGISKYMESPDKNKVKTIVICDVLSVCEIPLLEREMKFQFPTYEFNKRLVILIDGQDKFSTNIVEKFEMVSDYHLSKLDAIYGIIEDNLQF